MTDIGAFCIDTREAAPALSWFGAAAACRDSVTVPGDILRISGKRLCRAAEWYAACEDQTDGTPIGLSFMTDDHEWIDDWLDSASALGMGSGACTAVAPFPPGTLRAFRCCQ